MIFPADNAWNQDVSASAVDPNSAQILSAYAGSGVKADFGSGLWDDAPIGIPFVVVCASQPKCKLYSVQMEQMEITEMRVIPDRTPFH